MNYLDIIFIIILAFFLFSGLRKGFVKTVGGILGIIVGIYIAGLFYFQVSEWLQSISSMVNEPIGNILGFILVFIVANRLFAIVIWMLDKIVSIPIINSLNKLLGALLGLLQGILLAALILTLLTNFNLVDAQNDFVNNSQIAPYISLALDWMQPLLPNNLEEIPSHFFEKGKEYVQDQVERSIEDMTIDELIDYLNADNQVEEGVIEQIKERALEQEQESTKEYIIEKFKEYLDNLDLDSTSL